MQLIRDGLNITILPELHRRTLVWIHGFGDTAELFAEDFFNFPLFPDTKFVLPTADERPIPLRENQLFRAWYTNLGESVVDESIEESISRINRILDEERKQTDCLMIGGFSQGAAMSYMCGLSRYEGKVDAIIALSGFAFDYPVKPGRQDVPILSVHGTADEIIPFNRAKSSYDRNFIGLNMHLEVVPNLGHEVTGEEYEFITKWVRNKLNF